MSKFYLKVFVLFFILFFMSANIQSYASQRYVLEDRKIKSVCINEFKSKQDGIGQLISDKLFTLLKNNNSNVIFEISSQSNGCEAVMNGEVKEYLSEVKTNTIADSLTYDILEQQVKVSVEIEITENDTKDLIWKRKAGKYNSQSWLNFTRSRIGDNNIESFFYVPSQLAESIRKQYDEKEFIENTVNGVIKDLSDNLVKLK